MITNLILMILVCTVIGAIVHLFMGAGNHGVGLPHFAFVGGSGWGLGCLLELITGIRVSSSWGTIGLWITYACIAELAIRCLKRRLMERENIIETE